MATSTTGTKEYGRGIADQLKDVASQVGDKTKDAVSQFGDKTKEAVSQFGDKAKEAAGAVGSKAKEAASAVGEMFTNAASAAGSTISQTAEKVTSATGSGVKHLGETIKEKGPHDGMFGGATRAVGDTLEQGGKYLEQEGFSGMIDDVTELVRKNPMPAVLVGIGIGFLIGRTLRS
jgi:ElaB/YqjD/DUF883 family membrane-anchored ribosome-binding protein